MARTRSPPSSVGLAGGEFEYRLAGPTPERGAGTHRHDQHRVGGQHSQRCQIQVIVVQVGDQDRAQRGVQPAHQRHDALQMHHAPAQHRIGEDGLAPQDDPYRGVTAPDDVVADRCVDMWRAAGHRG